MVVGFPLIPGPETLTGQRGCRKQPVSAGGHILACPPWALLLRQPWAQAGQTTTVTEQLLGCRATSSPGSSTHCLTESAPPVAQPR